MNQWAKSKNELLKNEFERYKKENKNKKFHIDHFKIVVSHVEDKIKRLMRKNSDQLKMVGNIMKMNFDLLFSQHPDLFPNYQKEEEKEEKEKEEEKKIEKEENKKEINEKYLFQRRYFMDS